MSPFLTSVWDTQAVLTLFQVLTGDAWQSIMFACMKISSTQQIVAPIFFILFYTLANYIALNLFVASILSAFAEATPDTRLPQPWNNPVN